MLIHNKNVEEKLLFTGYPIGPIKIMVTFLVIAAVVVPLNLRMARKYQRRIDALDAASQSR